MPYVSDRQRRFFHTPTGTKQVGAAKVKEFDQASVGKVLPEQSNTKAAKTARMAKKMMAER